MVTKKLIPNAKHYQAEIVRADKKIDQLQDALYWAWYGWNGGNMSNEKIAAKVHVALAGYKPYEKRSKGS